MQANEAIRGHHRDLIATLDGHVSALAAGREDVDPAALVEGLLREHGRATATMSVDHEYIEGYVAEIEKAVQAIESGGDASRARERLERLVLQLQAVLQVHLEKEERIYLPLMEQHMTEEEQEGIVNRMHSA